ncbi:hypothetical protein HHK36_016084 [Tetracentron sinense]|uniref:WRKY domain-containing protein n=1 Tax=Tetracentron sinense TaxID=13715 RepID=A0A834Z536_TETSI|nr:hypothetical protein HHK36_016084 [Tetracentron sinense]
MASSTGSFGSSPTFSFSSQFFTSSFTDLLAGDEDSDNHNPERIPVIRGLSERIADRTGAGVPKFKSIPPPSLPISSPSPSASPSSYFAIPPGLSPADLLDSPVLLSTSNILPSPTTGSFPAQGFNWRSNSSNYQQGIKQEDRNYTGFSFQPQTKSATTSESFLQSSSILKEETSKGQRQAWNFPEPTKQTDFSSGKTIVKSEVAPIQSFSPEISTVQANTQSNGGFQPDYNQYSQPTQSLREQRRSEDGYNWRKYGQKQVKGSENPRSYYKCTHPNCPTKKKVERSLDGQITEIVYKGSHNHPKPQSTRRSSASSQPIQSSAAPGSEISNKSYAPHGNAQMESVATPDNSSISMGEDDFDQSSQRSKSGGDEIEEDEPEAKRWKKESENESISASGNRTVREPRVVVQTRSDIDILDDGYRWRKYGQKVVKGNPNPRSYYKCTNVGCPVRKHVERASHDLRAVITTYEGKHNHDVPAARGSGGHTVSRPSPDNNNNNNNNNEAMAIRPLAATNHSNHTTTNSLRSVRVPTSEDQVPFTLEMLQSPGSFGFSGFGNSYMSQPQHTESVYTRAKDEPRDDLFMESMLC